MSPLPERELEPPENYIMEPECCRKCKEDECPLAEGEDECSILVEYEKQLEAEYKCKKQEDEWEKQGERERYERGEDEWNPDHLVRFGDEGQ